MKKFKILIPVYNDWDSIIKLLDAINNVIKNIKNIEFHCIIVNDASTIKPPDIKVPPNLKSLQIINMIENKGHARCNAFAIRYLAKQRDFDHLIVMDGDGEDRPQEIESLVKKALEDENVSVVAKRIKRSEGFFFQMLYQIHKIITLIFTGKNINFGNYSCLTQKDVKILSKNESLWSSFSGSVKKHIPKLNSVNSIRGLRYFGPSKMSLYHLGIHSLSIISVFKITVFLRSAFFSIIIFLLKNYIGLFFYGLSIFMLIVFIILIYLISLRENIEDFLKSAENIESIKNYTH